jgi:hypothetical protein
METFLGECGADVLRSGSRGERESAIGRAHQFWKPKTQRSPIPPLLVQRCNVTTAGLGIKGINWKRDTLFAVVLFGSASSSRQLA